MIELRHPLIEEALVASGEKFTTLVIENPPFFRRLLGELKRQIDDDDGPFFLFENGKASSLKKNLCLLTDPLLPSLDEKKEDTLFQKETSALLDESGKSSFEKLRCEIDSYLRTLSLYASLPYEFDSDFALPSLLKLVNFRPRRDGESDLQSFASSVLASVRLLSKKAVVICHLHGFLDPAELSLFFRELANSDISLFALECRKPLYKLDFEKLIVVDSDLCEY